MRLHSTLLPMLAFLAASTSACASYVNCKCHDATTKLQSDDVGAKACYKYKVSKHAELMYSDTPHHQVCSPVSGRDLDTDRA